MKYKQRFPVFIVIASLLLGTLSSTTALAGNNQGGGVSGEDKLNQIKNNPCISGTFYSGGVPTYACTGWTGAVSWISVPISTWEISPEYPLVGVPFYIGIGSAPLNRPGTNAAYSFSSRDVTFHDQIDFDGLRTEIRLIPTKQSSFFNWDFNGVLDYDYSTIGFIHDELINYLGDELDPYGIYVLPEPKSVASINSEYYPVIPNIGVDTVVLQAYATMSSYHATSPSLYKGEPAYRMEVASHYLVQARVSWDSYRLWERVQTGTTTVCRPGPDNAGNFDCRAPVGNWYEPGHYVTKPVYEWRWGAPHGEGSSAWANITPIPITTDKVVWPDGTIHDHIPILVYQSQPLLQKP